MVKNQIETGPVELLDDEGAAALLGVEPRTVREWRLRRGLPHIKITSKVIRIRRPDLDVWLGRNLVGRVS